MSRRYRKNDPSDFSLTDLREYDINRLRVKRRYWEARLIPGHPQADLAENAVEDCVRALALLGVASKPPHVNETERVWWPVDDPPTIGQAGGEWSPLDYHIMEA